MANTYLVINLTFICHICRICRVSPNGGLALDESGGDERRVSRKELAAGNQDHEQPERQAEQPEQQLLETGVGRLF